MDARLRGNRGQAVAMVVLVFVVAGAALMLLSRLGGVVDDAARARTAADAAALAGALAGESDAARLAAANGGELESYEIRGPMIEVVVRVGHARARARAVRELLLVPP